MKTVDPYPEAKYLKLDHDAFAKLRKHLSNTSFRTGCSAYTCPGWYYWIWMLADIHRKRSLSILSAVAAAKLCLPYYEQKFQGDLRPRLAIEGAERCLYQVPPDLKKDLQKLLSQFETINSQHGWASTAIHVSRSALKTALTDVHFVSRRKMLPPPAPCVSFFYLRKAVDENYWLYHSFNALTSAASGMALIARHEKRPFFPKWSVANDEGKLLVQEAVRLALLQSQ